MSIAISTRVGKGQPNSNLSDNIVVQILLNKFIVAGCLGNVKPLGAGGSIDSDTIKAITVFQRRIVGLKSPDGMVDPNGKTLTALNGPLKWPKDPPDPHQDYFDKFDAEEASLIDQAMKELRSRVDLTPSQYSLVHKILSRSEGLFSRAEFALAATEIAVDIAMMTRHAASFKSASLFFEVGRGANLVGWMAIASPLFITVSNVLALSEAMDFDIKLYRAVSAAYTATAWTFNERAPANSRQFLNNQQKFGGHFSSSPADLARAWDASKSRAQSALNAAVTKQAAKLGRSQDHARRSLRVAWRAVGKTDLARMLLRSLGEKFNKHRLEHHTVGQIAEWLTYPN